MRNIRLLDWDSSLYRKHWPFARLGLIVLPQHCNCHKSTNEKRESFEDAHKEWEPPTACSFIRNNNTPVDRPSSAPDQFSLHRFRHACSYPWRVWWYLTRFMQGLLWKIFFIVARARVPSRCLCTTRAIALVRSSWVLASTSLLVSLFPWIKSGSRLLFRLGAILKPPFRIVYSA